MCSETSPRISFSNDLTEKDDDKLIQHEIRRDTKLLESNSDFEFNICSSIDHESSSADELFADGMILPAQVHETSSASNQTHLHESSPKVSLPPLPCNDNSKKETRILNSELEERKQTKSFWGFKRSSSLNCDIKKSLICSLPLLSRSYSTGTVPNPKQKVTISCKDINKQNSQKQQLGKKLSASSTYVYALPQKPPLKKYYGGSHGNGVRISPVLNVPSPYIKGAANLFGLGSFLRNGKEKNRR